MQSGASTRFQISVACGMTSGVALQQSSLRGEGAAIDALSCVIGDAWRLRDAPQRIKCAHRDASGKCA
jgi:hypothetical protein